MLAPTFYMQFLKETNHIIQNIIFHQVCHQYIILLALNQLVTKGVASVCLQLRYDKGRETLWTGDQTQTMQHPPPCCMVTAQTMISNIISFLLDKFIKSFKKFKNEVVPFHAISFKM